MEIRIGSHKVTVRKALQTALRKQLVGKLRRFGAAIAAVQVEVSDRNGRRGGGDKRCRIRVTLVEGDQIVRDDVAANLWTACKRAMDRLENAVRRELRVRPGLVVS